MKPIVSAFILVFFSFTLYAQIAVSYFPFQSVLSVSSNTEKRLWVDYKVETNTFYSNLNMELSPKINLSRTEWVNVYVGAGMNFNPANEISNLPINNGYFIDFGVRIKPIIKNRNIQLVFEISPYENMDNSGGTLRTRLGISYNFNRRVKSTH